jgi:amino acid adenylation domain-containing protein/non-ribosomal peptide synthase protein (TIGR01720 family)
VLFNYDTVDTPKQAGDLGWSGSDSEIAPDGTFQVKFDLAVRLGEAGDGMAGEIKYGTALFDAVTVERMVGHLVTVLGAVAADAGMPVSSLPVLTEAERHRLIQVCNDTATPVPAVGGVHELIAAQVATSPDAVAVVSGGRWLTYGGLTERAEQLAHQVRSAGVGPEPVVGLCLPRCVEMVVAIVAVWRAGGAYLPLDPEYPRERLEFMLADSAVSVVVSRSGLLGERNSPRDHADNVETGTSTAARRAPRLVMLDDPAVQVPVFPAPPPVAVDPGQLAYVIYTSGSTGRPKGVQVPHGAVVNLVTGMGAVLGGTVLQFASFSFDAAALDVAATLAGGGTLVVAGAQERVEPERLIRLIRGMGVTAASVSPSLLSVLDPGGLAGVGTLLVGSEPVSAAVAGVWGRGRRMFIGYGPTETTVISCTGLVDPDGEGAPPIGSPVANTAVYVLDRSLNPVPAGVTGELFIAGAQVARGYGERPALTAERYVADPFAAGGSRMYRSGDRVRWRADGRLEFFGRADDQLKIRGFRVEPGEIETVLAAHPSVRTAVVTVFGEEADRRLAAYLVPADHGAGIALAGELRAFAGERLPEFMIPAVFAELDELPMTPNGKLDRAALPAPGRAHTDRIVAPATPTEELLAGIWAQVLGVDRVGAEDNVFELGGHSLLATLVASRIRGTFGVEIPLYALFDAPTVRGLASVVEESVTGVVLPPVTAVGRDRVLPLSFAQRRLWILDQLEPGSAEYNVAMPIRWDGDLDVAALGTALERVVARHEVLRTRLVAGADEAAHQVIGPPGPVPLPVADVSGEADPLRAAERLVGQDSAVPFDLAGGPLIRALLIRLRAGEHVLALSVHHVISDEWSGRILRRELSMLHAAFRAGEPDPLPPLAVQYADFAVWQQEWLSGEVLDGQLAYWRDHLEGLPVLELPLDRPRPPVRLSEGAMTQFTVPAETVDGLRALARAGGATMFMTLFAAFAVLLGRYCGTDDVVVGTPVANRNRAEIEDLIGFFVNSLVLRVDVSGDPTFTEVLGRVREMALAAYAHQDVPFEQLVDALVTDRDQSRSPLFQVLFNYFTGRDQHDTDQEIQAGIVARVDLRLILADGGGGLAGAFEYSTALFDATTVQRMVGHLVTVLGAVAADADRLVSRLPVLSDVERHQVVHGWNGTGTPLPAVGGVHELFVARAEACPDAVAVVAGGRSLSYAGLTARAARLAHYLRSAGVGAETVVGLCLPRDADMVVAMLAVWQGGGAYVPLDPEYPAERLEFMLADSKATVVVGTGDTVEDLPVGRLRTIALDDPAVTMVLSGLPSAPPRVVADPGQLAYVMYTSGSTGTPKGVQVAHRGVVNLVTAQGPVFGVGPGVRVVQFASFNFDAAVSEVYVTLVSGGTLVVASAEERAEPDRLAGLVRALGVEVATLPPSLLGVLAPGDLEGLGTLVAAGERLEPGIAAVWQDHHRLLNTYGPTELTVCASIAVTDPSRAIGKPIANTRVLVLDRHLNPVPVGMAGEVFIAGAGVARGYGGRPALTAERFVADPFATDGSRMYRSGDRARWRTDGQLEFIGRVDEQLKIRGFRVEPGEIEAALSAHPGIQAVVVMAFGDEGNRRLAAYLVPADPAIGIPAVAELREHLLRRLPDYMVPAAFTELAELPRTPNGKVDRAALPAPGGVRAESGAGYVTPRTAVEWVLAEVWAQVLGVDRVGVDDNFFELGGDSIIGVRAVARARTLGVFLHAADLFEYQTIAELAAVAEEPAVAEAEQGAVTGEFPLSPVQRWFFARGLPEPSHYNQSVLLEAPGGVEPELLRVAVRAVVEHHDALRSRFTNDAAGWTGRVLAAESAEMVWVVDATDLDEWDEESYLSDHATAAHASLDLARGPLVRVVLFDRGARCQLLVVVHHLVVDAVSWPILVEDLSIAYAAAERGGNASLTAKTSSFAAWSRRLAELADSAELAKEARYWRGVEEAVVEAPRDREGVNSVVSVRTVSAGLSAEQTSRLLHDVPGVFGTQINDVLLAALGLTLTPWTRTAAVAVDVEGHGREDVGGGVDVSRTVGWFTSVYPVVLTRPADGDLGAALRAAKEYLRAVPRRGLGYGVLRYLTDWAPGATPDVAFNYLGQFSQQTASPGGRFTPLPGSLGLPRSDEGERAHLIDINGRVTDGRMEMVWSYSDQIHDEVTVARLAHRYIEVLGELIDYCCASATDGYTPSDFPLAGLDQQALDAIQQRFASPAMPGEATDSGGRS